MSSKAVALLICFLCLSVSNTLIAQQEYGQTDTSSPCSQLVAECFESFEVERSRCFFSASNHPFCDGTPLGELTHQRWMISPDLAPGRGAQMFLGPQLVDKECLENFDNLWLGMLLNEKSISSKIPSLTTSLETCKKEISHDLSRP